MDRFQNDTERQFVTALRAALPASYRLYHNIGYSVVSSDRSVREATGHRLQGEIDVVVLHPDLGLLCIEVKGGSPIECRGDGEWMRGGAPLGEDPVEQARSGMWAVVDQLERSVEGAGPANDWRPSYGWAVAFPDADLSTASTRRLALRPDLDRLLVLDKPACQGDPLRHKVNSIMEHYRDEGHHGHHLEDGVMHQVDEWLRGHFSIRRLMPETLKDARRVREVFATRAERLVLEMMDAMPQLEVIGPAGSGKSMLAARRALDLASQGNRVLLVCYNQPLSRELASTTADAHEGRVHAITFHRLCEELAGEVGTLPPKPVPVTSEWWSTAVPEAFARAEPLLQGRFSAIVVDEGQDFELDWYDTLLRLLPDPRHSPFVVFHDPDQALDRDDVVEALALPQVRLTENLRNPGPIAVFASHFAKSLRSPEVWIPQGELPHLETASTAEDEVRTLDAMIGTLLGDGIATHQIAVLTGNPMAHPPDGQAQRASAIWRHRVFGGVRLWNASYTDDGAPTGASGDRIQEPPDAMVFESIRRFKGLERSIVFLVELPDDVEEAARLLYVGSTRATYRLNLICGRKLRRSLNRVLDRVIVAGQDLATS